jgi:hypothetical protein
MSISTRFLLLVIIGIAIAIAGMHIAELFIGLAAIFALMIGFYGLPLIAILALLVIAWKIVSGLGGVPKSKLETPSKEAIGQPKPNSHIEIERELNRMRHQIGQINKKNK